MTPHTGTVGLIRDGKASVTLSLFVRAAVSQLILGIRIQYPAFGSTDRYRTLAVSNTMYKKRSRQVISEGYPF